MARKPQSLKISNSYEYTVSAPADARLLVDTKDDLYDAASFPFPYVGMMVSVKDIGKAYILKTLPTTDAANWSEIGADVDTSVIEAEVAKKAEGYIETTTVATGTDDSFVLQEGQIVKVSTIGADPQKTFQGVVAVDSSGTYGARDNLVAEIDCDGEGKVYIYTKEAEGTLAMDSQYTGTGNIDGGSIVVITETIHKIDSRLLPKGQAVDTQDYLQNALTVKEAQGKYKVGDIIAADTDLESIIINMLTRVNNPTVSEPKVTLAGTGDKLLESGATINATLTATFDRGAVSPVYNGVSWRAGEATAYSLNGGGEQAENTFSVTVSESNKEFTATVKYAAGEEIVNDEGGKFMDALEAGSKTSNTVKYDFVDALYSNAANMDIVAKEALVAKSAGQKVFNFSGSTPTNPEEFHIPASWTVIGVDVENEMNGKFEPADGEFVVSDSVHPNAANVDVAYKVYKDNRGFASGPRKIRVRWS